jgi:hypothetical protein
MSLTSIFQDIADAIRSKTGKSESIYPVNMASEIEGISSGTVTMNIRSGARVGSSLSLTTNIYESEV